MYHYNITYSNIAWKNKHFLTEAKTDSDALAQLIDYEGNKENIRIINIETVEIEKMEGKRNEY